MNLYYPERFRSIVQECIILLEENKNENSRIKLRIKFIDGSFLFVKEAKIVLTDFLKYSYQWQRPDNSLILRWDNTAHHPHIDTFPFHKHIGSETNVLPSEPMTIEKVLTHIASQLSEG
jgi:Family of unknown function (DUF6516)